MEEMRLETGGKRSVPIRERHPGAASLDPGCFALQRQARWMTEEIQEEQARRWNAYPAAGRSEPADFDHRGMIWVSEGVERERVRIPKVCLSAATMEPEDFDFRLTDSVSREIELEQVWIPEVGLPAANLEPEDFDIQINDWMPAEIENGEVTMEPEDFDFRLIDSVSREIELEQVRIPDVGMPAASLEPEDFDFRINDWMPPEIEKGQVQIPDEDPLFTSLELKQSDYEVALRMQIQEMPPSEVRVEPLVVHPPVCTSAASMKPVESDYRLAIKMQMHEFRTEQVLLHELDLDASVASTGSAESDNDLSLKMELLEERPEFWYFQLLFTGVPDATDKSLSPFVKAVIFTPSGDLFREIVQSVGPEFPGKLVADCLALRSGLKVALDSEILHIQAICDNENLGDQLHGDVHITSVRVMDLLREVMQQIKQLEFFELKIVPKIHTAPAWEMVRQATTPSSTEEHHISIASSSNNIDKPKLLSRNCCICFEDKTKDEMIIITDCSHEFCRECTTKHTEAELKEGRTPRCPQPNCRNILSVEQCRDFLPDDLYDILSKLLAEAVVPESERLYCPYPDCSELFQIGWEMQPLGEGMEISCISCGRRFCPACKAPSHWPLTCRQYEELPAQDRHQNDLEFFKLAVSSKWKRCAKCHSMIQRNEGCPHMTCRCGYQFCYLCEAIWKTCPC